MVSQSEVSGEKAVEGMLLKGKISGKENWVFVPLSQDVSPVQRVKPEAVGFSLRRQSMGGMIGLKFNLLPEEPVVVKNTEIVVRRLSQDEIFEFAEALRSTSPNAQVFYHQSLCFNEETFQQDQSRL